MSRAFRLGGLFGGRLFFYDIGDYASHEAAVRYYLALPGRGAPERSVTIETVPRVAHGVEYGHDYVVRDFAGRVLDI